MVGGWEGVGHGRGGGGAGKAAGGGLLGEYHRDRNRGTATSSMQRGKGGYSAYCIPQDETR